MSSRWQRRAAAGMPGPRDAVVLLIVVALDLFLFSETILSDPSSLDVPRTPTSVVLLSAVILYGILLFRRQAQLVALLCLCACSVTASLLTNYRPIIPICMALAGVVAYRPLRSALVGGAAVFLTSMAWVYADDRINDWSLRWPAIGGIAVGYLALPAVAAAFGWWRKTVDRIHENRRAEATRLAVSDERRRLARELHDIVAQAVTLMVLQAAGARAVVTSDPQSAAAALDVVERTGTQAISELRRLLAVLRTADTGQTHASTPGLADLPDLLRSIRTAGVDVTFRAIGSERAIDRSVDAAAYRVVSEALTNVTKHSGVGTAATVQIEWREEQLDITIWDNGGGQGADERLSTGNGLLGLTERIMLVGGEFESHPRDSGGYEVHATLPLPLEDLVLTTAVMDG